MILENRDELVRAKLKEIVDTSFDALTKITNQNKRSNLQDIIDVQYALRDLVREADILYSKLDYLKHAY